ncbi:MAG: hypothetical protein WBW84_23375 [Acidobacteriaceae bacterium]
MLDQAPIQGGSIHTVPLTGLTRTDNLKTIRLGIAAGLFACLAYPLAVFAPLPKLATVSLMACFGPALAVGCYGIKRLIDLEKPLLSTTLGLLLNVVAGGLFVAMGMVQLAIGSLIDKVPRPFVAIWLGLDVAWSAYVGFGTICFSVAMWKHPRFGRTFAISGIAIGAGLLALHLYTFPLPPKNAGLVDLGPALGLWYLVVVIRMWQSLSWARLKS